MMVEKGIYEIGRVETLRKQNEDGVNSTKVEARIGRRSRTMGDGVVKCRAMSEKIEECLAESQEQLREVSES
jgi:hypothetical protein